MLEDELAHPVNLNFCPTAIQIPNFDVFWYFLLAQSFSPFSSCDGQQVCCPDPTRATNLFSKIKHKLVAQIQLG
jgi:hypothetical protein